jgi:3',5'-cyclic-AMP phosphodiesterase
VLWTVSGGVPRSALLGASAMAAAPGSGGLTFVQISDSHIGFSNPPNTDTAGTLREAMEHVTQLKGKSSLLLHTGDVTHLSRAGQFDIAEQIIKSARNFACDSRSGIL